MLIERIERTMGTTTMAPRKKRDTANRALAQVIFNEYKPTNNDFFHYGQCYRCCQRVAKSQVEKPVYLRFCGLPYRTLQKMGNTLWYATNSQQTTNSKHAFRNTRNTNSHKNANCPRVTNER